MLIAEVGEPPNITEAHGVAKAREEEVALIVPRASLGLHRHLRVDLGDLFLAPTLAHGGHFFELVLWVKTQKLRSLVC